MEFQEVVRRRRMVRNFEPERPVDVAVRERLLENALRGPSAGNSQGFEFLVCETPEERELFWTSTSSDRVADDPFGSGLLRAPLIVVAMSNRDCYLDRYAEPDKGWTDRDEARWPVPYWHIDTGMAALLVLLTAVDAGLGACLFGIAPDQIPRFRAAFGVPDTLTPIGAVAVGHAAPDVPSPSLKRGRRGVGEAVHWGRY